jgi:dolichyl-phosphate-mannose--protein O-mannosyl transferase
MMEKYPYFNWGVVAALFASLSSGFAYLTMRRIGTKISSVVITMYMGAFMAPSSLIVSLV